MNKILIIDDEEHIRHIFKEILTRSGYMVEVAAAYRDVIDLIDSHEFDVILADILLRDYTGLDVLEEVKKRNLNTPVIMITGKPSIENATQSVRLGAYDYLSKPVSNQTLRHTIEKGVRHKKLLDRKRDLEFENEQYRYRLEEQVRQRTSELEEEIRHRLQVEIELEKSENRFRTFFEKAPVGMAQISLEGRFILINQSLADMFGYDISEIIGKHMLDITHPADSGISMDAFHPIARGDIQTISFEKRYIRKDGQIVWILVQSTLISDNRRQPMYLISQLQDITDRKKAKETIKQAYSELDQIFNSITDGMCLIDPEYRIIRVNNAFSVLFDIGGNDIVGKKCFEVLPQIFCRNPDCPVKIVIEKGKLFENEYRMDCSRNGRRVCLITGAPFRDVQGDIHGIVMNIRDITKRVEAENQAKTREKQLIRSERLASLGVLVSGVAHEINNPINGIINYAQIILNETAQKQITHDVAGRILLESERIAEIVKKLLYFARGMDEERRPVNISTIISDAVGLAETLLRKDGIKIIVKNPADIPLVVANHRQIHQVFMNLISNARYALNQRYVGYDDRKILEIISESITIHRQGYVRITFLDYGTGIPHNILEKIFDPFYTSKPPGEGTGLGLSISYGIVNEHKGRLWFDTRENEYTRAIVELPVEMR